MGKTLTVGDIHLKQDLILPRVEAAMEKYGVERVVFHGDYSDEWRANDIGLMDGLIEFADWVETAREKGITAEVLLGNHDYAYFLRKIAPGTIVGMEDSVFSVLNPLKPKIAVEADGWLLSHAGLTCSWADEYLGDVVSAKDAAKALNLMSKGDREDQLALYEFGAGRGGWGIPGPLWADEAELSRDPIPYFNQIVGHTPVGTCSQLFVLPNPLFLDSEKPELWACDTFSLTSKFLPIGDGTMLLLEDGVPKIVGEGEDIGFPRWEEVV